MISFIEFIFMLLLAVGTDILEIIATFCLPIPVIGIVFWGFTYFFGLIISLILNLWIFLKGAKIFWNFSMSVIDGISTGFLPARTLGIILTYLISKKDTSQVALKEK